MTPIDEELKLRKIKNKKNLANLIEFYVNNPDITMNKIGKIYGIKRDTVSVYITKYYFGLSKDFGETITLQSKINAEELNKKDQ